MRDSEQEKLEILGHQIKLLKDMLATLVKERGHIKKNISQRKYYWRHRERLLKTKRESNKRSRKRKAEKKRKAKEKGVWKKKGEALKPHQRAFYQQLNQYAKEIAREQLANRT